MKRILLIKFKEDKGTTGREIIKFEGTETWKHAMFGELLTVCSAPMALNEDTGEGSSKQRENNTAYPEWLQLNFPKMTDCEQYSEKVTSWRNSINYTSFEYWDIS